MSNLLHNYVYVLICLRHFIQRFCQSHINNSQRLRKEWTEIKQKIRMRARDIKSSLHPYCFIQIQDFVTGD